MPALTLQRSTCRWVCRGQVARRPARAAASSPSSRSDVRAPLLRKPPAHRPCRVDRVHRKRSCVHRRARAPNGADRETDVPVGEPWRDFGRMSLPHRSRSRGQPGIDGRIHGGTPTRRLSTVDVGDGLGNRCDQVVDAIRSGSHRRRGDRIERGLGRRSTQSANDRIAVQSGSPYSSMPSRATSPAIDVSAGAAEPIVNCRPEAAAMRSSIVIVGSDEPSSMRRMVEANAPHRRSERRSGTDPPRCAIFEPSWPCPQSGAYMPHRGRSRSGCALNRRAPRKSSSGRGVRGL